MITNSTVIELTPLEGITYVTPPQGYILTGRDGMVCIPWEGKPPIPLLEKDAASLSREEDPGYDMVGAGMYQALRLNPECACAEEYAAILRDAYPHVIAELAGHIVLLEAKDVDTPYLDRKINLLKVMVLLEPDNATLHSVIARIYAEKGSRLETLHQAVDGWYGAIRHYEKALELEPVDPATGYAYGEALYMVGRYEQAGQVWQQCLLDLPETGQHSLALRLEAMAGDILPLVPPVDYLTALAVALDEFQSGNHDEASAIIEDVLADQVFARQFPLDEIREVLSRCYQEIGMIDQTDDGKARR